MQFVGYSGGQHAAEFAQEYANVSGRVLTRADVQSEGDSLLHFYDPEEFTSNDALRLMSRVRGQRVSLGLFPVTERRSITPAELHARGRRASEAQRNVAYFGHANLERDPRYPHRFGAPGWKQFVEAAPTSDVTLMHTHGNAACHSLNGAVLCSLRTGTSQPPFSQKSARCLPCQAGGECLRDERLAYLGADQVGGQVIALLSCLAVSFADTVIAHDQSFVAELLRHASPAAILTSFRVLDSSTADAVLVDRMLRAGHSVGEVVLAVNEAKEGNLPTLMCVGDPDIRTTRARPRARTWRDWLDRSRRPPKLSALMEDRWRLMRAAAGTIERASELDTAPDAVELSAALGKTLTIGSPETFEALSAALGKCSVPRTRQHELDRPIPPEAPQQQRAKYLPALLAALESEAETHGGGDMRERLAVAIAQDINKSSSYIHRFWVTAALIQPERDVGTHLCGGVLYETRQRDRVFDQNDFITWACTSCGIIGYTTNGTPLPEIRSVTGNRVTLSGLGGEELRLAACVEPLRTLRGDVTPTVRSDGNIAAISLPMFESPGLNVAAIVGVSNSALFCLRLPLILEKHGGTSEWRLTWDRRRHATSASAVRSAAQYGTHDT